MPGSREPKLVGQAAPKSARHLRARARGPCGTKSDQAARGLTRGSLPIGTVEADLAKGACQRCSASEKTAGGFAQSCECLANGACQRCNASEMTARGRAQPSECLSRERAKGAMRARRRLVVVLNLAPFWGPLKYSFRQQSPVTENVRRWFLCTSFEIECAPTGLSCVSAHGGLRVFCIQSMELLVVCS